VERPDPRSNPQQFERLYTAVFLLLVGVLLLASNAYSLELWWVKTGIALALIGISALAGRQYLRERWR
jgi:membrane protein implicated in regulation of membrane protease activity